MAAMDYEKYTGPARLDRDIHILEGILKGVSVDGYVSQKEAAALLSWCDDHEGTALRSPYDELVPKIRAALKDGVLDEEERDDLQWLCKQVQWPNPYYSVATADMQRLHGMLVGVAADGRVTEEELRGVSEWLGSIEHLRGTWPYDEIDSLITAIMKDGRIEPDEHRALINFSREFLDAAPQLLIEAPFTEEFIREGICASCPEITFTNHRFCFTGTSPVGERRQLQDIVIRLGGTPVPRVAKDLDYLVVGAEGNRCWAFSCYGRKVEAAMALRKSGSRVTIAHENDFWDAAADKGVERPGRVRPGAE